MIFLLVGILGFVPGITTNFGQLQFAGHHDEAALPGLFNVSIQHRVVHLLFGAAGLALARRGAADSGGQGLAADYSSGSPRDNRYAGSQPGRHRAGDNRSHLSDARRTVLVP